MKMRTGVNYFTRKCDSGYSHLEAEIIVGDLTQTIWSPTYNVGDQMNVSEQEALNYLCSTLLVLGLPMEEITNARIDWLNERGQSGFPLRELVQAETKID